MEKKKLGKLSLKKEAISHLRPGTQARILGGGSDVTCYDSGPVVCDTNQDCMPTLIPCPRTVDQECNPYIPPQSAIQSGFASACYECPRTSYDCTTPYEGIK